MCGCVPGEVLGQCSAANPADIYMLSARSLRRSFTYARRRARDYDVHSQPILTRNKHTEFEMFVKYSLCRVKCTS